MRFIRFSIACTTLVSLCLASATVHAQSTLYVDDDAAPGGNGNTWNTAFQYLQDALAAASASGGTVTEIRVAAGTYKPDQGQDQTPGDREATFQLLDGLALKGSYAGIGAPDPNARDIEAHETILSGDLAGNDGPDFTNNAENSYHLIKTTTADTVEMYVTVVPTIPKMTPITTAYAETSIIARQSSIRIRRTPMKMTSVMPVIIAR